MFDEGPLPPLEGRRRTAMKVVIAGYFVVAAAWFATAIFEGGVVRVIFGILVSVLAAAQLWDFRRRTRPGLPPRRRRERFPKQDDPPRPPRGPRDRTFAEAQAHAEARARARKKP